MRSWLDGFNFSAPILQSHSRKEEFLGQAFIMLARVDYLYKFVSKLFLQQSASLGPSSRAIIKS